MTSGTTRDVRLFVGRGVRGAVELVVSLVVEGVYAVFGRTVGITRTSSRLILGF